MSGQRAYDPLQFSDGADQDRLQVEVPIDDVPLIGDTVSYTEVPLAESRVEPSPPRPSPSPAAPPEAPHVPHHYSASGSGDPLQSGGKAAASTDSASAPSTSGGTPRGAPGPRSASTHGSGLLDSVQLHGPDDFVSTADRPSTSSARTGIVRISVSDPVKRVGDSVVPGLSSAHYEYLVATEWVQSHTPPQSHVRRRFNDFVALADLLETTHRGYFVFPRPDRNRLEGQLGNGELVKTRTADLERYLRRLADHPAIGASEELRTFLEAEGQLSAAYDWQRLQPLRGGILEGVSRLPRQLLGTDTSVPNAAEASQNARNTSDLLRRMRELNERMKQDYGSSHPQLDGDEIGLRERRTSIEGYFNKLANASRKAEKFVQEFEDRGAVMGDLGMSLIKLANYEEQEGGKCGQYTDIGLEARAIATDSRRIGTAAVRYRRLGRVAVGYLTQALAPLHDELALTPAALGALKERESALVTTHLIRDDIEKKRAAAVALEEAGALRFGGSSTKAKRVTQLQNEAAAAEATLTVAQTEYDRIKSRNVEELDRWAHAKAQDFRGMVDSFASVYYKYEERGMQILQAALEEAGAAAEGQ